MIDIVEHDKHHIPTGDLGTQQAGPESPRPCHRSHIDRQLMGKHIHISRDRVHHRTRKPDDLWKNAHLWSSAAFALTSIPSTSFSTEGGQRSRDSEGRASMSEAQERAWEAERLRKENTARGGREVCQVDSVPGET